jgi:hypothetical protein
MTYGSSLVGGQAVQAARTNYPFGADVGLLNWSAKDASARNNDRNIDD